MKSSHSMGLDLFRVALIVVLGIGLVSVIKAQDIDKSISQAAEWIDQEEYRQAIVLYTRLINSGSKLEPFRLARIWNNLGFCYFREKEYKLAFESYSQALLLDPSNVRCLNNISALLIKQKKFKESLDYLEKAFALDSAQIKVVFNLFVAHARLKDSEKAKSYLKMAFALDREYTIKRMKMKHISDRDLEKIEKLLKLEKG